MFLTSSHLRAASLWPCCAAHLMFGRERLAFVRAFCLFSYIQGTQLITAHFVVASLWLTTSETVSRTTLLLTIVLELVIAMAVTAYAVLPILRAYRPRWYRLAAGSLLALIVFVIVSLGISMIGESIAGRFPSS
jgi:hypothetical protein